MKKSLILRLICVVIAFGLAALTGCAQQEETLATFAMDTMVTQSAYGRRAMKAMQEVNLALAAYEQRLSLFDPDSDIAKINAAAGQGGADVAPETAALLQQAIELSTQEGGGAFALTIAPLTLAWGVTSDAPRLPAKEEIEEILPLIDDSAVLVEGEHVTLLREGMAIDLGGIAKGAACSVAADIYEEHGVKSAWLSIGGNIYVRGTKPDGSQYRVGFQDPNRSGGAYIASFAMQDKVIAVSGGYERFFEADGQKYIHIFDPRTGYPAQSDVVSVGVIHPDGAVADFYSTSLFVHGRDAALEYMRGGGTVILLDEKGVLYVSESLRESFELHDDAAAYLVEYVAGG